MAGLIMISCQRVWCFIISRRAAGPTDFTVMSLAALRPSLLQPWGSSRPSSGQAGQ